MKMSVRHAVLHNALLAAAGLALMLALAVLYLKTEAVDLRERTEAQTLLRALKDIDSGWDFDVLRDLLRAQNAGESPGGPAPDRASAARKIMVELNAKAARGASPALRAGLPELDRALSQKALLAAEYLAVNEWAHTALQMLLKDAPALAAEAADPRSRAPALAAVLAGLAPAAAQYYAAPQPPQRTRLETLAAQLDQAPARWRERTAQLRSATQSLLKNAANAQALYSNLRLLTSGPRLDTLISSVGQELEETLQDKERFRVYLISYAGALLVLLAYLGARLRSANTTLERRVDERTRELQESEAQLIQSEKMSALGQMVSGVAHELNTPLAYVKHSLGTVAAKLPQIAATLGHCEQMMALLHAGAQADGEELRRQYAVTDEHLARLHRQRVLPELTGLVKDGLYGSSQMAQIASGLTDFSRLDRSKVASYNLNEGLDSTLLLARHLLKAVAVDKHYGEIPLLVCASSQVNQVLLNLITNAAQALGEGGGIVTITTRTAAGGVAVEVADNGPGIAPDVLPKIFDPFFSTKDGKGLGLGLAISYKIVQLHGGRIDAQSELGSGTKFTVWLPLMPPAGAAETA